jgi:hypothetical protein
MKITKTTATAFDAFLRASLLDQTSSWSSSSSRVCTKKKLVTVVVILKICLSDAFLFSHYNRLSLRALGCEKLNEQLSHSFSPKDSTHRAQL